MKKALIAVRAATYEDFILAVADFKKFLDFLMVLVYEENWVGSRSGSILRG